MLRSLVVAGTTPYHQAMAAATSAAGVPTTLYRGWGPHLPDHVDAILADGAPIVHLQWPEAVCWRGAGGSDLLADMERALLRLQAAGRILVWTMHNLCPHAGDEDGFWAGLYGRFARHVAGTIHHSRCGMALARRTYAYGSGAHAVIGHGWDPTIPQLAGDRVAARRVLRWDPGQRFFLSLGAIRPDKRIDELLTFWRSRSRDDEHLVIAGSLKGDHGARIRELAAGLSQVHLLPGHCSVEDLALLARAADAFLFIHGAGHLTSGGPHLAQACLTPMIGPGTPYNREVLGEAAWYLDPERPLSTLAGLLDAWDGVAVTAKTAALHAGRQAWDWSRLGEAHVAFYRSLL